MDRTDMLLQLRISNRLQYTKRSFAEVSKNLARYRSENKLVARMLKLFAAMSHQCLRVIHNFNYFNSPKLLSDLYLAKFLDTSATVLPWTLR